MYLLLSKRVRILSTAFRAPDSGVLRTKMRFGFEISML